MANLERGAGFRKRVRDNYQGITSEQLRALYAAASISYSLGYSLPLGIATRIANIDASALLALLTNEHRDLLLVDEKGVRLPHRITASIAVDEVLSSSDRTAAVNDLAIALALHIDTSAISSQSRHYRLLRILMRQTTIMRLIGEREGRISYGSIQDCYDWNGRYWEQRALFESACNNHTQARSYAEHSISIHAHPFAFNTLGTILGRIAIADGDPDVLRSAISNLNNARDQSRWDTIEHPYITFFTTVNRFGERWGLSAVPSRIRADWDEWFKWATNSFQNPSIYNQLLRYQSEWLRLAT